MLEKKGKYIMYPSCLICRGRGRITVEDYIEIKCPACHYNNWNPLSAVRLLINREDASKIKQGTKVTKNSFFVKQPNVEETKENPWKEKYNNKDDNHKQ